MKMVNGGLQIKEQGYRSASRAFDYFVVGLSSVLFLATALTFEAGRQPVVGILDTATIVLFALAVIVGLKKLEYSVAVIGADYSIALTEANPSNRSVRETTAVLRDLNETVESLTNRASIVHRLRNWLLVLGIATMIASFLVSLVSAY
jgi:hypothetical protein